MLKLTAPVDSRALVKDIKQTDLLYLRPSTSTDVVSLLWTKPIKETGQVCALNCACFLEQFRQTDSLRVVEDRFRCSVILFLMKSTKFNIFSAVNQVLCLEPKERQTKERANPQSWCVKKKFLEKICQSLSKLPLYTLVGRWPAVWTQWLLVDHWQ